MNRDHSSILLRFWDNCIFVRILATDGRTDGRTNRWTVSSRKGALAVARGVLITNYALWIPEITYIIGWKPDLVKFITGRPGRSADMPVLFLHSSPKKAFRPAEATRCPDKREIWYGERTLTKFHVYWGINVGIQPQNCQNFEFWP